MIFFLKKYLLILYYFPNPFFIAFSPSRYTSQQRKRDRGDNGVHQSFSDLHRHTRILAKSSRFLL
jgi:hypothetical protein